MKRSNVKRSEFWRKVALVWYLVGAASLLSAQSDPGAASATEVPSAPLVWGDRPSNLADKEGPRRVFLLKDSKVVDLSPAGQDWRLLGVRTLEPAKPSSKVATKFELWGIQAVSGGWKVWRATSDSNRPALERTVYSTVYPNVSAVEVLGPDRAVVFDRGQGPELETRMNGASTRWAWDPGTTVTAVALGKNHHVAVCGYRVDPITSSPPFPFLWSDGNEIAPLEGWRGILSGIAFGDKGVEAAGRGAPSDKRPVQALLYDGGVWKTLDVSTAGNFPSFVGSKAPEEKTEPRKNAAVLALFGAAADKNDGHITVWFWTNGQMTDWKTEDRLVALGPASFEKAPLIAGLFRNSGAGALLKLWDGKKETVVDGWPEFAVPRGVVSAPAQGAQAAGQSGPSSGP